MQVAIARMHHRHRGQTRLCRLLVDQGQHLRQGALGNDRILHQKIRTHLPEQSALRLARLEQSRAHHGIVAELHIVAPGLAEDGSHRFDAGIDQRRRAVDLDDEEKVVLRQPDGHRALFHHGHRGGIHHFNGHGIRRAAHQSVDGPLRRWQIGKGRAESPRLLRPRRKAQPEPRESPERSLGPNHEALPILAPWTATARRATEAPQRAVEHDHFHTEHVIAGHAVAEAMRPAGIRGHVAPDRADRTARGIRRIMQARGLQRFVETAQGHPAFQFAPQSRRVDFTDGAQSRRVNDRPALRRDRSTGQRGAGPAQANGNTGFMQHPHYRGQLLRIGRNDYQIRRESLVAQTIRVIAGQLRRRIKQTCARGGGTEQRTDVTGGLDHEACVGNQPL